MIAAGPSCSPAVYFTTQVGCRRQNPFVPFQVQYQHSPGGFGDVYRALDEAPDRQGTLEQRQRYIAQYQVQSHTSVNFLYP